MLEFLANIIFKRDNNMHSRVCRRICEYVFNIKCNAHGIVSGHAWPIAQETRISDAISQRGNGVTHCAINCQQNDSGNMYWSYPQPN